MTETQGPSIPRELSEAELDGIYGGMMMVQEQECAAY